MKRNIETIENENNKLAVGKFEISEESRQAFIRAMKIGYFKAFHKQGLLTDSLLERLIDMNTNKDNSRPAS